MTGKRTVERTEQLCRGRQRIVAQRREDNVEVQGRSLLRRLTRVGSVRRAEHLHLPGADSSTSACAPKGKRAGPEAVLRRCELEVTRVPITTRGTVTAVCAGGGVASSLRRTVS